MAASATPTRPSTSSVPSERPARTTPRSTWRSRSSASHPTARRPGRPLRTRRPAPLQRMRTPPPSGWARRTGRPSSSWRSSARVSSRRARPATACTWRFAWRTAPRSRRRATTRSTWFRRPPSWRGGSGFLRARTAPIGSFTGYAPSSCTRTVASRSSFTTPARSSLRRARRKSSTSRSPPRATRPRSCARACTARTEARRTRSKSTTREPTEDPLARSAPRRHRGGRRAELDGPRRRRAR